jgi:hypothetical protein
VLEAEAGQLRTQASQHKNHVKTLERRIENLVMEVNDANEKTKQVLDDQTKLAAEKNALIQTVKKLNRDVAKLESFKRHLLQTLQDEEDTKDSMNLGIDLASDRMISNVLSSASSPVPGMQNIPVTPSGLGAVGGGAGGATPDGRPTSPGGKQSPKVDGKEIFRTARSRLGYDDFSSFLQNIKELNAGRQTREETLKKAQDIFKSQNADLYKTFEGLLSRHIPGQ